MCSRPGCIAQDPCPIHGTDSADAGAPCDQCRGTGSYFYVGQQIQMCCQMCGGTGLRDKKTSAPRKRADDDPVDERPLLKAAGE